MTRAHVVAYRLGRGRIFGSIRGAPILLLHHTGRRSGRGRVIPLLFLPDGENLVIVASRGGSRRNPSWFHNLKAMPETTVEIGGEKRGVRVRVASSEERERLWPRVVDMYSHYADYQARTEREIPLVVLSPS
jgi:deazaflavin-dependent oxidoreductase (nitroreductase family)